MALALRGHALTLATGRALFENTAPQNLTGGLTIKARGFWEGRRLGTSQEHPVLEVVLIMAIRFKVHGVLADTGLKRRRSWICSGRKNLEILPIWVGLSEGNAIRFALEGILPPRPMTHDLLRSILDHLGARVVKVIISEIKKRTLALHDAAPSWTLVRDSSLTVDARPSDAIAPCAVGHPPRFLPPLKRFWKRKELVENSMSGWKNWNPEGAWKIRHFNHEKPYRSKRTKFKENGI